MNINYKDTFYNNMDKLYYEGEGGGEERKWKEEKVMEQEMEGGEQEMDWKEEKVMGEEMDKKEEKVMGNDMEEGEGDGTGYGRRRR